VRSGFIYLTNTAGTFRAAGQWGYDRSSRSYSTATNAYFLSFDDTGVHPSDNFGRSYAFPLRCLSTVLGM